MGEALDKLVRLSKWEEEKHPRTADGKFTSAGADARSSGAKEMAKALDKEVAKLPKDKRKAGLAIARKAVNDLDSGGGRKNSRSYVAGKTKEATSKIRALAKPAKKAKK